MIKANGVAGNLRRLAAAAGLAVLIGFGASATEANAAPVGHSVVVGDGIGTDSGEGPNPCPPSECTEK